MDDWWFIPAVVAALVGVLCPVTGSILITQRRLLQANLITHAVLPGIVLALAFGWNFTTGGLISAVLGALLAEQLNQRFPGREDGVMNTVLAGFIALGVLLIPLLRLRIDLESLLFGDLLAANDGDLLRTVLAGLALVLVLLNRYRDFVYLGVDPEGAAAAGRPVAQLRFAMTLITALVVICSLTAVGVVLVIALLCAPVLLHVEQSSSLRELMLRSAGTGLLLSAGGMGMAIALDLPPGPLIGVLCVVSLLIKPIAIRG